MSIYNGRLTLRIGVVQAKLLQSIFANVKFEDEKTRRSLLRITAQIDHFIKGYARVQRRRRAEKALAVYLRNADKEGEV